MKLTNKMIVKYKGIKNNTRSQNDCKKRIKTNRDLTNTRASPEFDPLEKRFDESFINENAINAIKSLFGFNKK